MAKEEKTNPIKSWLKNPASWLSFVAVVISVITFLNTNFNFGSLQVDLSDEVAMQFEDGMVVIAVPTVIFNTASSNFWATINNASLRVQIKGNLGNQGNSYEVDWTKTLRLYSALDYEKNYPDRAREGGYQDYLDYESRKIPFSVSGKNQIIKIFEFVIRDPDFDLQPPVPIELTLELVTSGKAYQSENFVYCVCEETYYRSKQSQTFQWFRRSLQRNEDCQRFCMVE